MLEDLLENFLNVDVLWQVRMPLLRGALVTLELAALTIPLGLASGLALALAYHAAGRRVRRVLAAWIDFFRAFPPLVLLIYFYYGGPMVGIDFGALASVTFAFTANTSSYFGEIFRAGIESVPRGQWDAARALSLGPWRTMFLIVLPQGVRAVLPDLVSNLVPVTQLSALASVVAFPELLRAALVAQGTVYNATPLIGAAAIYLLLLWPIVKFLRRLESPMRLEDGLGEVRRRW